uniref:Guanine nucleotide-binding protein subunit beta-like protein n=1 Tax=Percolomonas cosmopolitus TaxID=63605 RepID=A0A7S1PHA4_9EUKA|mmetsp:Transcript_7851/g.29401  ORF Transcript_7851/g.29401 Transcript_7851/m.29401 type:complete len:463 (+) Transcript_7851:27-1415(+)
MTRNSSPSKHQLLPFSHIQHDWYLSPLLLSSSSHLLKQQGHLLIDQDKSHINRDTFWVQPIQETDEWRYEIRNENNDLRILRKFSDSDIKPQKEQWNMKYDKAKRTLNVFDAETNALEQQFTHERRIIENVHGVQRKPILSVDISPQGELGVSSSTEGSLRVWNTKTGHAMRDMSWDSDKTSGHVGDVYVSRFLPSGQVVMSAGADTRILIWRISDALCAAQLKGHNGGVTSLSFIDRGRNFISSSRDGTVRLWDCATQSSIAELFRAQPQLSAPIPVNACVVQKNSSLSLGNVDAQSPKDFGTELHVGACAVDDGRAIVYDVRHRKIIFSLQHETSLKSCAFMDNILTVGQKNGKLVSYDVRKLSSTEQGLTRGKDDAKLASFTGSSSPVIRLAQGWKNSSKLVWFSCQDGSVRLWNAEHGAVVRSLSGFDYDAVYDIAIHDSEIYCGGRDGKIRQYVIDE